MTNLPASTQLPDGPRPEPPARPNPPRGFLDCRGEWQELGEDEDRDAAP